MRIVHVVCSNRFAGVERYLTYVALELADRDHDVVVIGGEPTRMADELAGTGVRFTPATGPVAATRALVRRRGAADIVHVHMTDAEAVGVLTRPLLRAPVVATLHFAQRRGSSVPKRLIVDQVARGLSAQVAISHFVADEAGVASATVVPNGLLWTEPPAVRESVVLVAQRLEPEKDGTTALRAWAASRLADQGWRMRFAGEGSEGRELRRIAVSLDVDDSVEFLGNISTLPAEMARAGVLLASAPAEPFGLSVVEAMAAGLPVVAAAGGAHLETVGPVEGTLFRPGDPSDAARLLSAMVDAPRDRDRIGRDLRQRYLAEYTIERHVDRLLEVYAGVMAGRSGRRGGR